MPTDTPPPRRNWHLARWFLVLLLATFGWSGWRIYSFRSALSQAKALGWSVQYDAPAKEIRKNWKAAFKEETWQDGVKAMANPQRRAFDPNLAFVHRLNPKWLWIRDAASLRDLSALKPLTRLQKIWLTRCTGLSNLDGIKNLSGLQTVDLSGCTGLTNVDALTGLSALNGVVLSDCSGLKNVDGIKNLSGLQTVNLSGCTGLTNVDAFKSLSALNDVFLRDCVGLTNVDGLENLSTLQVVDLRGCTG